MFKKIRLGYSNGHANSIETVRFVNFAMRNLLIFLSINLGKIFLVGYLISSVTNLKKLLRFKSVKNLCGKY